MIPSEIFAEDLMSTMIRYGLYLGAAFQLMCLLACVTLTDEQCEPIVYEKPYTDSDECSSEQSSPGHRANRARRQDKKKRR
ncbi:protein anon-73B1 [Leguminivora glycinivorella]|uniref:protein anon-73B1 n=1 Tax=Leguminivora glycinivorella TaxID=1035111 RepID=UPI00200E8BED|nr:protein anon-73B1 [Leguminivora glycinivorella]XP_047985888.1 protein anon-73B1 [Leguminivora glycinivorella]